MNGDPCPNCAFWKAERDKAVAHAMEFGPKLADIEAQRKWQVRPYEGTVWLTTTTPPTEETRRWLEYREILPDFPRDYSDALRNMKSGAKMRRLEWRPNKYVAQRQVDGSLPYLEIVLDDGRRAPYTPSACDQYGFDWVEAA